MKFTQFVKQFRDANPDLKMSHADCMKHPDIKKAFKEITGSGVCVNTRDGNVNIKINDAQKCNTPQTSGPQAMNRSAAPAPAIVRGGPSLPSPFQPQQQGQQQQGQQQQQQYEDSFLPPDETNDPTEMSSVTGYNYGSVAPEYGDAYEHSSRVTGNINPFTPFAPPMGYDPTPSDASSFPMDAVNPFQTQTQEQRQAGLNVLEPGIGYYSPAIDQTRSIPNSQSSVPSARQGLNVLEQGIPYYAPPSSVEIRGPTANPVVVPPYGSTQSSFASQSSAPASRSTVSSYPFDMKRPDAFQRGQAAAAAPGAAVGLYSRMEDMYDNAQQQAKNASRMAGQKAMDIGQKVKSTAEQGINDSLDRIQAVKERAMNAGRSAAEQTSNTLQSFMNSAKSNPEVKKGADSIIDSARKVSEGNINVNGRDVSAYVGRQATDPNSIWNSFYNAASNRIKDDPFGAIKTVAKGTLIAQGYTSLNPIEAAEISYFLQKLNVPEAYSVYAGNSIAGFNSLVPAAAQVALGSILVKAVQAGPQAIGPAVNLLQGALAMVPPAAEAIAEYGPYLVGFGIAGPGEGFNDSALAQFEKQWRDKLWQGEFNSPKEWDSEKKKWVNVKAYRSALARMEPLRKKAYRDLMVRLDRERDREAKLLIKSRKR